MYHGTLQRWALERAMYANAHFRATDSSGKYTDKPFTPGHFLGTDSREEKSITTISDKLGVVMANAHLSKIVAGNDAGAELPAWALGEYHDG